VVVVERRDEFEKLLDANEKMLRARAMKFCKHEEDAKDLFQAATLKMWKYFDSFTQGTNFSAWAHNVMKNTFINTWRRETKRHKILNEHPEDVLALNFSETQPSPERVAVVNDKRFSPPVQEALDGIDEVRRETLLLREVGGLSYAEIAEETDSPVGTVMSRLYRVRRMIKERIECRLDAPKEKMAV